MSSSQSRRSPRAVRPPKYAYDFSHLKSFPQRLLFPPHSGVGRVRSFKITPVYDITLNDVLEGKHLPPITLKDFEDYLVFEARSEENLYFICWLRDYTTEYNRWQESQAALPEEKRQASNPELTVSFARARGTFFDPSSHLELNLPGDLVEQLLKNTQSIATPSPDLLADVQKHVEAMLRESLMKFVVGSCKNSGRRQTAGFIPYYEPSITATSTNAHSSAGGSSSASPYKFDFDTLPRATPKRDEDDDKHWSRFVRERAVFASLTKVFSPVVTRAQWDIVMRSALLGVLVALILGGICIAIPFKN
ncbi:hypothetical protein FRC01_004526 [Tulasnella sp. 417]|nr:hypothetical protein FRC01_004526 [Tulasnella sp. 417]